MLTNLARTGGNDVGLSTEQLSRWVNSGRQPVIPKQLPESTSATIRGFWDEGGRITAKMELFAEAMLLAMRGLHASLDTC